LKREFFTTGDGSVTIHLPEWNEQYHSKHGAIAEAIHVFIKTGLHNWLDQNSEKEVSILEIGFGTGLNTFLTLLEASRKNLQIKYTAIEAYPVLLSEIKQLNYVELLDASEFDFLKLHQVEWETFSEIHSSFQLKKQNKFFSEIEDEEIYDLIYFDAFGARVQPELWTEEIFKKMISALIPGGILVTYAAKGSVRRAMQAVGFTVERLPGPPGKREMLRARKNN
jgi:tRNA U34 5-methylaminomethyl-2-thiouridine-forming methyltransferase MnmC